MIKRQYNSIDVFKLIMAIFVIAIHTRPFEKCENSIILAIYNVLVGLAVPFFFLASGFLMSNKFEFEIDSVKNLDVVKRTGMRILKLYIIWTIIYLPLTIYHFVKEGQSFVKTILIFVRGFLFLGEQYNSWPLWYLLSTIYAMTIIYFLLKKGIKRKGIVLIGTIFLAFSAVIDGLVSYEGTLPFVIFVFKKLFRISIAKGRLLTGVFYISVGIYLQKSRTKKPLALLAFIGGVITSVCLSLVLPQFVFRESILLVTKVITSVGLFEVVRMLEWKDGQYYSIIRNMSTILYFIHMYVWTGYYMLVYKTQTYGWDSFLVTTGLSMLVAWMYLIIKRNKTSSKNNVR